MSTRLQGKVAVVTGGAQGIGRAIARRLYEEGASVVIADLNGDTAEQTARDLSGGISGSALGIALDVSRPEESRAMVERVTRELGSLDILVNNAGVGKVQRLEDITEADWNWMFDVNVKGLFFCTQAVAVAMKRQRSGKIINLASIAGRQGEPLVVHYCATKAAVISITQSTALELAPFGINVNAVAPGIVDTPFWVEVDKQYASILNLEIGQKKREDAATIPLGRIEQPEDVAPAVAFLASSDANYITGQTLNVEGGLIMC